MAHASCLIRGVILGVNIISSTALLARRIDVRQPIDANYYSKMFKGLTSQLEGVHHTSLISETLDDGKLHIMESDRVTYSDVSVNGCTLSLTYQKERGFQDWTTHRVDPPESNTVQLGLIDIGSVTTFRNECSVDSSGTRRRTGATVMWKDTRGNTTSIYATRNPGYVANSLIGLAAVCGAEVPEELREQKLPVPSGQSLGPDKAEQAGKAIDFLKTKLLNKPAEVVYQVLGPSSNSNLGEHTLTFQVVQQYNSVDLVGDNLAINYTMRSVDCDGQIVYARPQTSVFHLPDVYPNTIKVVAADTNHNLQDVPIHAGRIVLEVAGKPFTLAVNSTEDAQRVAKALGFLAGLFGAKDSPF